MEKELARIADALEGIHKALTEDRDNDDRVNFYELVRQGTSALCNMDETKWTDPTNLVNVPGP